MTLKELRYLLQADQLDPATGAPTEQAYKDINLEFVIPVMQKEGLIPGK